MSQYSKVIIFIVILIVFSGAVIYLHNTESSMNQSMPDISSSIVAGDSDYNSAVDLLNGKNYNEAKNKVISAKNNFNQSMIQLLSIKNNITSDTNDVHKNYINTVIKELELKINATKYLLESIDYYEKNQNSSGNEHSSHANQLMRESIDFQNVRNNLVKENPNLFK